VTLDLIIEWFESLTPATLGRATDVYTADAYFKDPFNEVRGVAAIQRIFAHMFNQVAEPRFRVTARWQGESGVMLAWDFIFRRGTREQVIRGVSHLLLAPDGRIKSHRDYWDAAGELYETVPALGALMRLIRRRLAA
jgi:steroid delta-isomerase